MYSPGDTAGSHVGIDLPSPGGSWCFLPHQYHCPDFLGLLCYRDNPSLLLSPAQWALKW